MLRATKIVRAADVAADGRRQIPFDVAVLAQDERHLRRKVIMLVHGDRDHLATCLVVADDTAAVERAGERDLSGAAEVDDGRGMHQRCS